MPVLPLLRGVGDGLALSRGGWERADALLRTRVGAFLCAEHGFDRRAVAEAGRGWADPGQSLEAWDAAIFLDDEAHPEPLAPFDLDRAAAHAAIREATGEEGGRPSIPHSAGGCAAFAVVLSRVFPGGRIVGMARLDDPRRDTPRWGLRLGNLVLDGSGVHDPVEWFARWGQGGGDGIAEVWDPSPERACIRARASREHGLNEGELEGFLARRLGASQGRPPAL